MKTTTKTETTPQAAPAAAPATAVAVRSAAPVPAYSYADLEKMARAIASSKLFGVQTKEGALALMLLAQAEGRHPAIAARDYHIIEGRPALKADAMLARFQEAGGRVQWHELTDTKCSATFTSPQGDSAKIEWTIDTAKAAGLVRNNSNGSPGMWMKYPRPMLRSRVVSEGVRTIMPSVIVGVYTPDELQSGANEADDPSVIEGEVLRPAAEPAPRPALGDGVVADCLAAMEGAASLDELAKLHAAAYRLAYEASDIETLKRFDAAKNAAKARLTGGAA